MFILYLVEQGWFGVITFVFFWFSVLLETIKNKNWYVLAILIPVILIIFNTETVIGVDSEQVFLWSILLMLALDNTTEEEIDLSYYDISKYVKSRQIKRSCRYER